MTTYPVVLRSAVLVGIDWVGKAMLSALILTMIVLLVAAIFFDDPTGRLAAERRAREPIDAENRHFCAAFAASERYDECAAALNKIRDAHGQRLAETEQGFL